MNGFRDDWDHSSSDANVQEDRQFQELLNEDVDLRVELHHYSLRLEDLKAQRDHWKDKVSDLKEDCKHLKSKCDSQTVPIEGKPVIVSPPIPASRFIQPVLATISIETEADNSEEGLNVMPMEYRLGFKQSELLCLHDLMRHYKIFAVGREGKPMAMSCRYVHQNPIYWHANQMTSRFPDKFCKMTALYQVTREFADRGKMALAEKLYEAIWEDKDGFFELK